MMKKMITILLTVVMTLSLVSCGEVSETAAVDAGSVAEAVTEAADAVEEAAQGPDIESLIADAATPDQMLELLNSSKDLLNPEQVKTLETKYTEAISSLVGGSLDGSDYEAAAEYYDKAAAAVDPGLLKDCAEKILRQYAGDITGKEDFDRFAKMIDDFKSHDPAIDYDTIRAGAEELLPRKEADNALLAKAYEILSSGAYERIGEIDGSEEAIAVVEAMTGDRILYAPEGARANHTGVISGLYKMPDGGYYFFYGNVTDGKRDGEGVACVTTGGANYQVFKGEYRDDAPNGHGVDTQYFNENGDSYTLEVEGTYKNGLQDGEFTWNNYAEYVNTWTAKDGDAPMIDLEPYKTGENSWAYDNYMKPYALDNGEIIITAGIRPVDDHYVVNFLSYHPEKEYLAALGYNHRK